MSRQAGAATPLGATVVLALTLMACAEQPVSSSVPTTGAASTSPTAADESAVAEPTSGDVQDGALSGLAFARVVDGTRQLFVVQPTGELLQVSDHRPSYPGEEGVSQHRGGRPTGVASPTAPGSPR